MEAAVVRAVRSRAAGRCEYCRDVEELSLATFHCEHVIARQHGGDDSPENLALACPDCNYFKGPNLTSLDPATRLLTRLFHPRQDAWDSHFELRSAQLLGRTAIGRATAELLQLNSAARVRSRRLLIQLGYFK
jgi:5-methylcytosine-specific restriction endonuclease McrA